MAAIGRVEAVLRTDQGQVRDHNEDFVAYYEPAGPSDEVKNGWLYLVADGVGGAEAGEVASQVACEQTLAHYLADGQTADPAERLVTAIRRANDELRRMIAERDVPVRMATTLVGAAILGNRAYLANVGDSRGYHWKAGTLRQVTRDQSLVAELVEKGAITEEEAATHPRRNVILHSLGPEAQPRIDTFIVDLAPGERLVLCSDGLVRHVDDQEIAGILNELEPLQGAERLIALANQRGGEDNISVAVVQFGEQPSAGTEAGDIADAYEARARRALWVYTLILAVVQTLLIILAYYIVAG